MSILQPFCRTIAHLPEAPSPNPSTFGRLRTRRSQAQFEGFEARCLEFLWCLVFGVWNFVRVPFAEFQIPLTGLRQVHLLTLFSVVDLSSLKSISLVPDADPHHYSHGQRILRRCLLAFAWVSLLTLGDVYLQHSNKASHETFGWLFVVPANAACLVLWLSLVARISRNWRGIRASKRRNGALLLVLITGILWASFLGADLASYFAKPVTPSTPSSPVSIREEE